jgi:hypothetical protein
MTTHIDGLHFGSIGATAVHLCIDMQLMFAEGTKWASPAVGQVLPQVSEICAIASSRTIFTRFLTPPHLDAANRQWHRFYEESPSMLAENLKPEQLNLVPELRRFVPPARVVDRMCSLPSLRRHLPKASVISEPIRPSSPASNRMSAYSPQLSPRSIAAIGLSLSGMPSPARSHRDIKQ